MATAQQQTNAPATPAPDKVMTTKELFSSEQIRAKFVELLGKKAQGFIVSVLQVVASNEFLKKADPNSIYNAAAVAATLDLPLNNQLGFAYIVPYNVSQKIDGPNGTKSWRTTVVAQFQIGYKGYIQLGQRTGQYRKIAATRILEGQLISEDPLDGYRFDFHKKLEPGAPVIGYASRFELINGFEKTVYMTIEELREHGKKYSKSFGKDASLWATDPEAMYLKTVLKQNLSKYGPMSIALQTALITDQGLIKDANTLEVEQVDSTIAEDAQEDKEHERITLLIANAKSVQDLDQLRAHADLDQAMAIARKEMQILTDEMKATDKLTERTALAARIKALEELIA